MFEWMVGEKVDGDVVAVGFRYMPISRQDGFLVIDRSMKQMLLLVSCVGFSWMLLWIVSMYCSILSGVISVESLTIRMSRTYLV